MSEDGIVEIHPDLLAKPDSPPPLKTETPAIPLPPSIPGGEAPPKTEAPHAPVRWDLIAFAVLIIVLAAAVPLVAPSILASPLVRFAHSHPWSLTAAGVFLLLLWLTRRQPWIGRMFPLAFAGVIIYLLIKFLSHFLGAVNSNIP